MARRGFQGAVLKTLGARDHELTVSRIEELAPHCRRIWMHSATLFDELDFGPTSWVRAWFPDPEGSDTQFQRGYTIVTVDDDTGEFAIDIVLHEPHGARLDLGGARTTGRQHRGDGTGHEEVHPAGGSARRVPAHR